MLTRSKKLWPAVWGLALVATIVAGGVTATAQADKTQAKAEEKSEPQKTTRQTLMEGKLGISQELLRGLVLRDFERIKTGATALNVLTLAEEWAFSDSKEYARMSDDLRRSSRELTKAAKAKDINGATLAYQRMTYSCVECHQALKDGFE